MESKDKEQAEFDLESKIEVSEESLNVDIKQYYIQIEDKYLQSFLGKGLILPNRYYESFKEKSESNSDHLILLKKRPLSQKRKLILTVILHLDEIQNLASQNQSNYVLYPMPLPISRLIKIEIPEDENDPEKYSTGWIYPDIPVPYHLFVAVEKGEPQKKIDLEIEDKQNKDFSKYIKRYNRCLGLLAFIKNVEYYFGNKTDKVSDYSEEFIRLANDLIRGYNNGEPSNPILLSILGLQIKYEVKDKNVYKDVYLSGSEKELMNIIQEDKQLNEKNATEIVKIIIKEHNYNSALRNAFNKLFKNPDEYRKSVGVLRKDGISNSARIIAVLYKFLHKDTRGDRIIKEKLVDDWETSEKASPIMGCIGAYYGYQIFDKEEHNSIIPDWLRFQDIEIKFALRTCFERKLIEAVYQHVFNKECDNEEFLKKLNQSLEMIENNIQDLSKDKKRSDEFVEVSEEEKEHLNVKIYKKKNWRKFVEKLDTIYVDYIDEKSELGKYLITICWQISDYTVTKKNGDVFISYKINIEKIKQFIKQNKSSVNMSVLLAAVDADKRKRSQ
jgi:hypothetical protein